MRDFKQELRTYFGLDTFRPGQLEALEALEAGKQVMALMPTGGGKSLIYQLFAQGKSGLTVIVSPLIALMQDQLAQLQLGGFKGAMALNSALRPQAFNQALTQLGDYRFLFLSPEMIQQGRVKDRLRQLAIDLFVVDEAHCILQWGVDFRPEYSQLKALRQDLGRPLTLALTATASPAELGTIQTYLFDPEEKVKTVKLPLDRPNIFYDCELLDAADKFEFLGQKLSHLPKPGIVYVHQKAELEALSQTFRSQGLNVAAYHADLPDSQRFAIQEQFLNHSLDVIFATSAFGMGINQADLRFVIHYHLPFSLNELSQESGRAGRDRKQAYHLILVDQEEKRRMLYFRQHPEEEADNFLALLAHSFKMTDRQLSQLSHGLDQGVSARLDFYRFHFNDFDQAKAHYQAYIKKNQLALDHLLALVEGETCLRQGLLAYFQSGEEGEKPAFCCSRCQPNFESLAPWQAYLASGQAAKKAGRPNWQERLDQLFNRK
ncbi:RecQ family ATP-dependent DNA helicase [Aerococcus sanguinicola]|uniref:RecQ family ATP-dependent DNA helicase n=1 Tax=unclassified Aerococcus TaxID=2618060 RepID=UPI0008A4865F|nr:MULTISPECIES: RecQ family ATP-dependent DNA helicase [unclassified Aerococcus]MDK6232952.1 RecQ family ATP-dependent DNA helicase [Aerococcus sp. UMB10185]MDK6855246.1 RecQ family ATP-dependent DNA helicase [Aerococcus sp. UMB7533]MDK8502077.1 RecQ family ATP-dependent DNA helicase [Aerococcus sp. UMB1112A]OFN05266.1 hypothetical protein HMPREF2626_04210 [Aerococcus sp. HMSC062A02]OHO43416.1 hypothetical protein HMPREF2705_07945 [Aerococcus sp. HMSC035B07]